jgi:hypothetical protein
MVFTSSWSTVKLESRPDEDTLVDGKRLDALEALMPADIVRNAVKSYLTAILAARRSGIHGPDLRKQVLALIPVIRRNASGGDWPVPAARRVTEETRTATRELTRYWVDCTMLAWSTWGHIKGGLLLGKNDVMPLFPEVADLIPSWERWQTLKNAGFAELAASIALTEDDLGAALQVFGENVRARASKQPVPIPGHAEVIADGSTLILRKQT